MNLIETLRDRAAEDPAAVAIIERDRQMTFGELWKRVEGGALQLRKSGLRKGEAILVIHPVGIELYEILLSAFHAGVVVVLLDPAKGNRFLNDCLSWYPVKAYFGSPKAHLLRLKSRNLRKVEIHFNSGFRLPLTRRWNPLRESCEFENLTPDSPALVTFTSGSTGKPKGVVRTHGFLLAQDQTLGESLRLRLGQVDLVTLPVFLLSNLSHGVTSVIADTNLSRPGFPDVAKIKAQISQFKIERCTASPAFFEALSDEILVKFKEIYTGGAPVFSDFLLRIQHLGVEATAVYGSTEAEPISHFEARDLDEENRQITLAGGGLPAGLPVPEIELRIIEDRSGEKLGPMSKDDFKKMTAEVGEIVVSGEHVLSGYLEGRGDEETKISVEGKVWHRTGDAGRLDESGQLWLLGRTRAKWKNLYPLQIEAAARLLHPGWRCAFFEGVLVVEKSPHRLQDKLPWAGSISVAQVERIPMDLRHNAKVDYPRLEAVLRGKSE